MILTKAEVKEYAKLDSSEDSFIETLIKETQDAIERYIGQNIEEDTNVDYFTSNDKDHAFKKFPVQSISSLKWRNYPTDDWSSFDSGEYTDYKDGSLSRLYIKEGFIRPFYKLTYTSGYKSDEIPEALKLVAKQIIYWSWVESGNSEAKALAFVSKSLNLGTGSVSENYMKDWKEGWFRTLRSFRTLIV